MPVGPPCEVSFLNYQGLHLKGRLNYKITHTHAPYVRTGIGALYSSVLQMLSAGFFSMLSYSTSENWEQRSHYMNEIYMCKKDLISIQQSTVYSFSHKTLIL